MKIVLSVFLVVVLCASGYSQTAWSVDVAPIIYDNCSKCHHEGGIGPFNLLGYQDMIDGGDAIVEAITTGFMPPWPANPDYQHFANENVLSDAEIQTILDWVSDGSLEGNPDLAPQPPVFNNNSALPSIDFTGQTGNFASLADEEDDFRTFVIPSNLSVDTFIDGIEIIPGNAAIIHHALVYYDPTDDCLSYDAADPGPGFATDGTGGGLPPETKYLAVWVPGNSPSVLPQGFGFKVETGGHYLVELHFPENTLGDTDNTTINIHYSTSNNVREVFMEPILYHFWPILEEGTLYILANDTATFHESYNLPIDVTLFNVFPHMHLIGRTIKSWGETSGDVVIPFVEIDNWDFHWQYTYSFPQLRHVPANTELKAEAFYDNTPNNPHQPNDPPQPVYGGEETSDEMMVVFFTYAIYQEGDEFIVVDPELGVPTIQSPSLAMSAFPNPVNDILNLSIFTQNTGSFECNVFDIRGTEVMRFGLNLTSGMNKQTIKTDNLQDGLYSIVLQNDQHFHTVKFVVVH
ncbi:MAG: T9SS type A sorting domain-containing protein [Flavobacteriales bacterium]